MAGVLGLTGVAGFLCYFVIMMLASAGIAAKTKFDIHSYFDSWNRVLFDGIAQGFMVSSALPFIFNLHFPLQSKNPSTLGKHKPKQSNFRLIILFN